LLADLDDLIAEVTPHLQATVPRAPLNLGIGNPAPNFVANFRRPDAWISEEKLYCPVCTKDRRVKINVLLHSGPLTRLARKKPRTSGQTVDTSEWGPSLLVFTCEQCALHINCLVYDEWRGTTIDTKLIVFPSQAGGLSTPHTPAEVKHSVDEAYKCQCVDAVGAAIEMYRVALEQLLDEQGYKTGMLNAKIEALEADRSAGNAKPWATDLDIEMLVILRKLGNYVAHPKIIEALFELNAETLVGVQEVFQFLLAEVYEQPKEQELLLASLTEMRTQTAGD
jgi:hypothetical protein